MLFGLGRKRGAALAERRPEVAEAERLAADGRHFEAIDMLSRANRDGRDPALERELRRVRHLAGLELLADPASDPQFPEPAAVVPARGEQSRIPEVTPDGLTPEVLRAAILDSGCLLVRGLMDRGEALRIADGIDHAFDVRLGLAPGESDPEGYYDELVPEPPLQIDQRDWIREGGGVLAADSPHLLFDMFESFENAGLRDVLETYIGEKPAVSAEKCTLRKATPDVPGAWHQDGRFLGNVRSMNVWLSLSRCGDVAPSMDVIPRRLDDFVAAGTEGTFLSYQVSDAVAAEAAGDVGIVRPIFDPGDALLFDEMFLHQTGSDPTMPNPRYAIESWFFGPSAYPDDFVPIAF
jgi:hypothetical protein